MFDKQDDSGVSPVIGVILMVAVTVALVALVTVTVFDIGGDVSESPDATVQLEQTPSGVQATLLRNENVDELYLQDPANDANTQGGTVMDEAGDVNTLSKSSLAASSGTGTVNVIADIGGELEVLTSTDYDYST